VAATDKAELIADILRRTRRAAVVGFSTDPAKAAQRVPLRMLRHGYEVVPVHPTVSEVVGLTAYPDLASVPGALDLVVVFRPPREADGVAAAAIAAAAGAVWLQLGITSEAARARCAAAGMDYVEDACVAIELDCLGLGPLS